MVRRLAAGCAAAAVIAGSVAGGAPAPRSPRVIDGFRVLAGDFHVHGYAPDGALPWWELAREAQRRGLDVIARTNHNRIVGSPPGGWSHGVLVLRGEEVTTAHADITAIGITRAVDWRLAIPDVAAQAHAAGGIAIGAHPAGDDASAFASAGFGGLDGIEAAHPSMFLSAATRAYLAESYREAIARRPGIAAIGSSDFHFTQPLGVCRTYLLVSRDDQAGVLEAIRSGRTVACDAEGNVTGPPALARQIAPWCAADARAALTVNTRGDRAAAAAVLIALALVVAGGGGSEGSRRSGVP